MGTDAPSESEPIAGRYTLDHVIGAGATAIVHKGRDLVTDQLVAVKVYRRDGAARYQLQQRREIAALTRLRHPGLVALHDGGIEPGPEGRIYLVTDLVDGPSLAERLMDGPLDVGSVRDLTARLTAALAHVHACGFIHRDIKPANILLDHGDEPRLADFGIARALDGTIATATGAVAGTAAYLAPEQVRGAPVDPAADVYALGLVLLEALTGRREYPGTVVESAMARLHRRPVVPADLPGNLTALLEGMTDPDPAGRPTAACAAAALAGVSSPVVAPAAVPAVPQAQRPSPSSRTALRLRVGRPGKPHVLLAAAVVLAFLLGGASLLVSTARSAIPALPSIGAAPTSSTEVSDAAPSDPSSTSAVTPPTAAAAGTAAGVPVEVRRPSNAASVAVVAYPDTGRVPAADARTPPQVNAQTSHDRETAATAGPPVDATISGNGNAKGKGKGDANGNGNGSGNGSGNGKGSGKKGD